MKGKGHMNKSRKFSPQFKGQIVLQLLSGERRKAELCREHQLTAQMIGIWKQQFLAGGTQPLRRMPRILPSRNGLPNWSAWWAS
jgi:transposase-like protein